MDWHAGLEIVEPFIVGISTPGGRGTGFLVSRSSATSLCAIATAAHVIVDADRWEQPIRIQHHQSSQGRAGIERQPGRGVGVITPNS
jgi:hypothetical protein